MAGNTLLRGLMRKHHPHTYNALANLVLDLVKTPRSIGKKTLFGKDKGVKAYGKLIDSINKLIVSMILDGLITESLPTGDVVDELMIQLGRFSLAHPNWQDAYAFADVFFIEDRKSAIAVIERTRK